jgi:hypothetical protein
MIRHGADEAQTSLEEPLEDGQGPSGVSVELHGGRRSGARAL